MSGPVKIGLTGSIGMGKSTTAAMFAAKGVPVWDADAAVARLYAPGGAAIAPVQAVYPHLVVDGAVSKQALKQAILADPGILQAIEAIVHPLVQADRKTFLEHANAEMVVLDIPLLFETGSDAEMDVVVVVSASPTDQRERVMARGTMTPAQFEAIASRQMPDAEKRARADHIVVTDSLDHARKQVETIIAKLKERGGHA